MGNKILIMILATFAMVSTAFADHHEGAGDGEKKPFSIYGDFASSIQFHSAENQAANGGVGNRHDDFIVDLAEINVSCVTAALQVINTIEHFIAGAGIAGVGRRHHKAP